MADPVEHIVAEGLIAAGIAFERQDSVHPNLDFYLPEFEIWVEVKQFHTVRVADQMSRVRDIIVIQGEKAAKGFVKMLSHCGGGRPLG